jgi:hypothetical protein
MSHVFVKGREGPTSLKRGEWRRSNRGQVGVIVCCPLCQCLGILDHEIDAQGNVTPSVQCPSATCAFHENGCRLEGWSVQG